MSYYLIASFVLNGTSRVLWWTGANFLYVVTPHTVYNIFETFYYWWYPPQTDSERLINELKEINQHLIELREAGCVIVEKGEDGEYITKELGVELLPLAEVVDTSCGCERKTFDTSCGCEPKGFDFNTLPEISLNNTEIKINNVEPSAPPLSYYNNYNRNISFHQMSTNI
jgi:hypothetical protein